MQPVVYIMTMVGVLLVLLSAAMITIAYASTEREEQEEREDREDVNNGRQTEEQRDRLFNDDIVGENDEQICNNNVKVRLQIVGARGGEELEAAVSLGSLTQTRDIEVGFVEAAQDDVVTTIFDFDFDDVGKCITEGEPIIARVNGQLGEEDATVEFPRRPNTVVVDITPPHPHDPEAEQRNNNNEEDNDD